MIVITNSFEKKFARFISKRNTDTYAKTKISISFFILILFGALCGIAFFDAIYHTDSYSAEYASHHFENIFTNCESFSDYFSEILIASKADIRNLLFIFISGFTYFCYPACGVMIFSKGFLSGFSVFYFVKIFDSLIFPQKPLILSIFILTKALIGIVAVYLAMYSYIFSYKFREIKSVGSVLRRAPIAYRYFFIFIYSIGGILLINYIYYFLIYNLIK